MNIPHKILNCNIPIKSRLIEKNQCIDEWAIANQIMAHNANLLDSSFNCINPSKPFTKTTEQSNGDNDDMQQ